MTLADILAAVAEVMDPDARLATIDELLSRDDINLAALQEELANLATEITQVDPADMTDEQINQAEVVAQLIAVVDDRLGDQAEAAEDEAEAVEDDMSAAAETDDNTTEGTANAGSLDDAEAAARKERAEAASQKLTQAAQQAAAPQATAAEDTPADAPTADDTPESGQAATGQDASDDINQPQAIEPQAPTQEEVTEVPASGAKRETVPFDKVAPAPTAETSDPRETKYEILASADLPGYKTGNTLDTMKDIGEAVHTGMSLVSRNRAPGIAQQLASIRRTAPKHLTYTGDGDHVKVDAITDQRNLPGKSLVAAGGWCSPSEFLYDNCAIVVSRDGMIDLPTITASRGGIKYTGRPDFAAMYQNFGFIQSEVDAIAGVQKPCFEIPCPDDLQECRMDISGICFKQPILTELGWPEKVEEFVEYAMLAHAHWMNAERIRRMVALVNYEVEVPAPAAPQDGSIFDPHGPGAFESVLSVLELQVEYFRYSQRMSRNTTLEAVAPYWFRGVLRADISKKLGIDDRWGAGADAALDRWFRDRGVSIQYVYDWQDALSDGDEGGFGGTTPPTQWPSRVQILLYEPGTYFALQRDVITLSGVYDSVDLQQNIYTRLFTEEGFNVCTRCGRSMLLTLNLCPNGLSGTQQRTQCDPVVTPELVA